MDRRMSKWGQVQQGIRRLEVENWRSWVIFWRVENQRIAEKSNNSYSLKGLKLGE